MVGTLIKVMYSSLTVEQLDFVLVTAGFMDEGTELVRRELIDAANARAQSYARTGSNAEADGGLACFDAAFDAPAPPPAAAAAAAAAHPAVVAVASAVS